MRVLGNVIWFVLAGFWLWLVYVLAGILACILIITIPFGIAAFRIAGFVVWPFGRTTIAKPTAGVGTEERDNIVEGGAGAEHPRHAHVV